MLIYLPTGRRELIYEHYNTVSPIEIETLCKDPYRCLFLIFCKSIGMYIDVEIRELYSPVTHCLTDSDLIFVPVPCSASDAAD